MAELRALLQAAITCKHAMNPAMLAPRDQACSCGSPQTSQAPSAISKILIPGRAGEIPQELGTFQAPPTPSTHAPALPTPTIVGIPRPRAWGVVEARGFPNLARADNQLALLTSVRARGSMGKAGELFGGANGIGKSRHQRIGMNPETLRRGSRACATSRCQAMELRISAYLTPAPGGG
jgi:hypothetical protein